MSIIKEEYWRIVELVSSPKSSLFIYIITFLLSVLNMAGVYTVGGFATGIIILVMTGMFEIFLWAIAFAIAFGKAYYSKTEGNGSIDSLKKGIFEMVKFNFPRQIIWILGIGLELLGFSIIYGIKIPVENVAALIWIGLEILSIFLAINLILGLGFSIVGIIVSKNQQKHQIDRN